MREWPKIMKKKVLYLVEAFGGGVFTFLVDLANGVSDEYDVIIGYSKRKQTPNDFKKYFSKNIKFIEIKNFTRNIGIKDIMACKEIRNIIRKEKPDIVHMHSSKAGIIGRLVISNKNRKLLYTPHGYSFLKQDDSKIKRYLYKLIEKGVAIYKRKCIIIACSKGEYEESLKISKNSTYVNNGVNIREIEQLIKVHKERKFDINNLKICTVGRIEFQKNPELFNKIAEQFKNIQFTWIGDGDLKDTLKNKNIKITGWNTREEVLKQLSNNDIFLLPSLWEGLPISLLESMSLGKICIVSNTIGNRDVIINELNGFVCNKIEDYIEVINKIICGNVNIEEISYNARKDVLEKYCTEKMCNKYKKLYN